MICSIICPLLWPRNHPPSLTDTMDLEDKIQLKDEGRDNRTGLLRVERKGIREELFKLDAM